MFFFFQAEDGIRDLVRSRGLGDVYKRQAFVEPFFFIGYLVSIALFGLFQAIFMANAGGAWDLSLIHI